MDPAIRKGIRRRSDWIRRNPYGARVYIKDLTKAERDKVDALFLAERKLKPNEVTDLVDKLKEQKLASRRIGDLRRRAVANIRANVGDRPKYREKTVVDNVKKMSATEVKMATAASADEITRLARDQSEGNPFWYH